MRCSTPLLVRSLAVMAGVLALGVASGAPQNPVPDWAMSSLRVGVLRGGGYDVAAMPLEPYVARVLAGEAAPDAPPAALEALAIAVRTYTLANRGRHRADGFDICDQTHCQVMRAATPASERASQATAGRVLLDHGVPASIFYSASCGGRTEIPSAVWPGADDPPFLPSQDDDACGGTPLWTSELAVGDLRRALAAAGFRGTLRDLRIAARNSSGRVARLALDGVTPAEISGQDLRAAVGRTLGWQHVRSTAFDLQRVRGAYRFTGHGSGHGVGMCVIGSGRLAMRGRSAEEILARYFPGLVLGTLPSRPSGVTASEPMGPGSARTDPARAAPGRGEVARPSSSLSRADVLVTLPDGDEGEREALLALVTGARDDLAKALGVAAPARVSLRFHPTTAAFEGATGRPWFTAATLAGGELHLLPPAVLRDRGVLERTVRHALVHLMADPVLSGRRLWVREGAALHFSDPAATAPGFNPPMPGSLASRASCPTDAEIDRPASIGALNTAYARARECFAQQIAAGRSWREVR